MLFVIRSATQQLVRGRGGAQAAGGMMGGTCRCRWKTWPCPPVANPKTILTLTLTLTLIRGLILDNANVTNVLDIYDDDKHTSQT